MKMMPAGKWFQKLRYYFQFFPVTAQGLLILAVFFLCYYFLFPASDTDKDQVDSFGAILQLLTDSLLWFILFFVLFGLLSTCISWLIYIFRRHRKSGVVFHFQTSAHSGGVLVAPDRKIPIPLLGAVRVRLVYDDLAFTPRFFWRGAGTARKKTSPQFLVFDDVKTYRLKGSFLFFEDLFRIFSFPVYQSQDQDFFRGPERRAFAAEPADPRVAESADVKTRQLQRIPGDFLNYKNFESGDDIRRIVWKLYAKNRELIVRTPEEKDRYASQIHLYASFHVSLSGIGMGSSFAREMLNVYKNTIWTVYDTLVKRDLPVRFEPDQLFRSAGAKGAVAVSMGLSNCVWQKDLRLTDYFNNRKGSIIMLSALNDPAEVDRLLSETPAGVKIILVKLSVVFDHPFLSDWISRIFMRPPEDRLKQLRGRWLFSPLRVPLIRNERALVKLLEAANRETAVL